MFRVTPNFPERLAPLLSVKCFNRLKLIGLSGTYSPFLARKDEGRRRAAPTRTQPPNGREPEQAAEQALNISPSLPQTSQSNTPKDATQKRERKQRASPPLTPPPSDMTPLSLEWHRPLAIPRDDQTSHRIAASMPRITLINRVSRMATKVGVFHDRADAKTPL